MYKMRNIFTILIGSREVEDKGWWKGEVDGRWVPSVKIVNTQILVVDQGQNTNAQILLVDQGQNI